MPPGAEYELTELGAILAPLFGQLVEWSHDDLDSVCAARSAYDDGRS